jgi:glutathione synthase
MFIWHCLGFALLKLALSVASLSPQTTSPFVSALSMSERGLPLDSLAATANAFAAANGVQVEKKHKDTPSASYFECAPISLLPNAYPRNSFAEAQQLAPSFSALVDRISRDGDFLEETLGGDVSEADPYTAKLLNMYREIYIDNKDPHAVNADRLGILRSDYMLHHGQIKQVELNTIAASFAGLSSKVAALHSFLVERFRDDLTGFLAQNKLVVVGTSDSASTSDGVPVNPALERLPLAMQKAVERYSERFCVDEPLVLFVVQEGESNTVDQRMIEFQLFQNYQIRVIRRSLTALHSQLQCDPFTGALTIDDQEIAVVYFRAGYAPTDYPDGYNGFEWQARAKLECSRATKCPSLGYHLAGTKKVQQELARPGALERFFPGEDERDEVDGMRSAFAGLYSLGQDANEEDMAAVKQVLKGGYAGFVLKPQREGGGYNFYGHQLAEKLQQNVMEVDDGTVQLDRALGEFILMERLFPPQQKAILLRSGRIEGVGDSISELGCYGTILAAPDGSIVHNEYAGYLLRTKFSNVDEGGVASGFATLSSPYLC